MFKFPPQFGDIVYYITGNISGMDEEYIHDGKRYTKYHIEYPTHEFVPLLVFSPAGDNVLTKEGLTEMYDGQICLSMRWDNDLYCHVRVVDKFYIEDWNNYFHNINVGEGDESQPDWIA